MILKRKNSCPHSQDFKPTTSRHRVVVTAHAVRGFRPVTTTPCRLPQQVTHRRSLEFRARACWNARRLARQVLVPAKPCTKPAKRGLAQRLSLLRWLGQESVGPSASRKLQWVRSVAARLCAHCRAHWLGGGVSVSKMLNIVEWTLTGIRNFSRCVPSRFADFMI